MTNAGLLLWQLLMSRMLRVKGIKPALSAWESDRSGPLTALTWASGASLVTAMDPETPGLMARHWPGYPLWQLNMTRRPPVDIVADLTQPEFATRQQVD
jgi:hypothetical protein